MFAVNKKERKKERYEEKSLLQEKGKGRGKNKNVCIQE